jgi:poly-gamma-glutamate synthesis protein (capsule biosynthesis protein)
MRRRLAILCAAALIMLFAATGAQATAVLEKIELPEKLFVDVGATCDLTAVLTPADAGVTITWTSSRPQYATVKPKDGDPNSCVITGKAMGRTYVYARVGGKILAQCFVTATAPKASSIKLNTKSVTLNPSGTYSTYTLRATTTPTYHSDSIEWKSGDESVATVSQTGVVTAVADGSETRTCTITATLTKAQKTATCSVTVTKIPEKYVRVTTNVVVPLYASRTLTAVVYPANAFDNAVTWEPVKNEGVVEKIKDNGQGIAEFKGLKSGTAVFKVSTANGRWALCAMRVKLVRYASLSVTPSSKSIKKDETYEIKIKRSPTYVSYPDISITSSDESVAKAELTDGKWIVTGTGRGYASLYVKADSGRVNRTLTVRVLDYENPVTVTVSAIGDVMLGGDPRKDSFKRFENLWKNGPDYFFEKIKSQLKGVVFANLETPLIDTTYRMQGSRSYIFRGKPIYAQALREGDIDAVDLDNNHIMDYGSRGYSSTKTAVKAVGVKSFGLGSVAFVYEKGIKIGFMGFRPENISISKLKANIVAAKKKCDILIVSFHWGRDYINSILTSQRVYGHAAVQAGADMVVGHHSHVVSGIEKYTYKGKSVYIVYGLGTIVSTVELPKDTDTFVYRHTFSVTGTSVSNVDNAIEIIPVKMTEGDKRDAQGNKYNDAQPVLAKGKAGSDIIDKIKQYSPNKNLPLFS